MISDHHGRTAGRATLLVRAMDGILGTHSSYAVAVAEDDRFQQPNSSREAYERSAAGTSQAGLWSFSDAETLLAG